jgi:hypothetical protein
LAGDIELSATALLVCIRIRDEQLDEMIKDDLKAAKPVEFLYYEDD